MIFAPTPTFEIGTVVDARGESNVAGSLYSIYQRVIEHHTQPVSVTFCESLLKELYMLIGDYSTENWDGYGALPIQQASFDFAYQFIKRLPPYISKPEIGVDTDGEITFEWNKDNGQTLLLSISGEGLISYAGIFASHSEVHGKDQMNGSIPTEIIRQIIRFDS